MNNKALAKYKIAGLTRCKSCLGTRQRHHSADILWELNILIGGAHGFFGPCFRCCWVEFCIMVNQFDITQVQKEAIIAEYIRMSTR